MEELISIKGLTFGFSGHQVLKELNAEFRSAEFSVILRLNTKECHGCGTL